MLIDGFNKIDRIKHPTAFSVYGTRSRLWEPDGTRIINADKQAFFYGMDSDLEHLPVELEQSLVVSDIHLFCFIHVSSATARMYAPIIDHATS